MGWVAFRPPGGSSAARGARPQLAFVGTAIGPGRTGARPRTHRRGDTGVPVHGCGRTAARRRPLRKLRFAQDLAPSILVSGDARHVLTPFPTGHTLAARLPDRRAARCRAPCRLQGDPDGDPDDDERAPGVRPARGPADGPGHAADGPPPAAAHPERPARGVRLRGRPVDRRPYRRRGASPDQHAGRRIRPALLSRRHADRVHLEPLRDSGGLRRRHRGRRSEAPDVVSGPVAGAGMDARWKSRALRLDA